MHIYLFSLLEIHYFINILNIHLVGKDSVLNISGILCNRRTSTPQRTSDSDEEEIKLKECGGTGVTVLAFNTGKERTVQRGKSLGN